MRRWLSANQEVCPSTDEWVKKNVLYPYHGILFSLKNENLICNNMNEPGKYDAK